MSIQMLAMVVKVFTLHNALLQHECLIMNIKINLLISM